MASRSPLADPSRFAIGLGVGCAHVLVPVLGFLERVTSRHERDPVLVLVILLALLLPFAYLRLAADGYRRTVERINNVTPEQAADSPSPAAELGWLGNLASIKLALAVAFLVFGFVLYMTGDVMLAAPN
jgi:hypothetical protein